jgi:hypothetical protein
VVPFVRLSRLLLTFWGWALDGHFIGYCTYFNLLADMRLQIDRSSILILDEP